MAKKKIIFQGEEKLGANSHIACQQAYPSYEAVPGATFEDVGFPAAITSGKVDDLGMILIENSLVAGRVADIHHLMPTAKLHIIGEHFMPVHHQLLAIKSASLPRRSRRSRASIHALGQCRKLIRSAKPQAPSSPPISSWLSARSRGSRRQDARASIATALAGKIYGLKILARDIEDEKHNTTRFIVLSPKKQVAKPARGKRCDDFHLPGPQHPGGTL